MYIYILIFLVFTFFLIHFDVNKAQRGKMICFKLEALVLILLFGLRYRLGGDSLMYEEQWFKMPTLVDLLDLSIFSTLNYQPLYYILVATVKFLGGGFVAFQLVHAVIVNIVFFKVIKEYCSHIFTAVLLYFVFMAFISNTEILRESLSVSIFLISIKFLLNKRYIWYYFYCIVAFNFHISAIICFLLPFFWKICSKPWKLGTLILISIVFILLSSIYLKILPLLGTLGIFSSLSTNTLEKIMIYTGMLGNSNMYGVVGNIVGLSVILYLSYVMRRNGLISPIHNLSMNMTFLFTALNILIPIVGSRWAGYFSLLYYMSLADLLFSFRINGIRKLITFFVLFYNAIVMINSQLAPDPWGPGNIPTYVRYIPYTSIFDKKVVPAREASIRDVYDL